MSDLETIISGQGEPAPAITEPVVSSPAPEVVPPVVEVDAPPKGFVPHKAIAEARSENRALKEQLAAIKAQQEALMGTVGKAFAPPPPPEPDWFQDPDAAIRNRLSPIEQSVQSQKEEISQLLAEEKYGADAVSSAMQAMQDEVARNPAARFEVQRMMSTRHPYGALVEWHKQRSVLSEIGTDPAAYREKLKAEILAEINATGVVPQAGTSAAKPALPSNFADQRTAGARTGPAWSGPKPIQDIFAKEKPR